MKSKSVDEYFSKARQLPITVNLSDIKSIVSTKGVTSPSKSNWWNLNNIIIMTTTILITTALIFTLQQEAPALSYQPVESSLLTKKEVVSETDLNVRLRNSIAENNGSDVAAVFENPERKKLYAADQLSADNEFTQLTEDTTKDRQFLLSKEESILENPLNSGLTQAPALFLKSNDSLVIEAQETLFEGIEVSEDTALFDSGIKLEGEVNGKVKTVVRTIDVGDLSTLFLENKNGDITVDTWSEAKVEVTAYFTIEARDSTDAKTGLDDFDFNIQSINGKAVVESNWDQKDNNCTYGVTKKKSLKKVTKLLHFTSQHKTSTNEGAIKYDKFKIEYRVKIPQNFNVDLKNRYADIDLGSISGNADIYLFHGDLVAKDVGNLSLKSKYGKAEVGNMKKAEVSLFHSNSKLGTSTDMDLVAKYSTVEIGELTELKLEGFQSKLKVDGKVGEEVEGSFKYGKINFEQDVKNMELYVFHAEVKAENIKELNLDASYCKLKAQKVETLELERAFQSSFKIQELGEVEGELKYSPIHVGVLNKSLNVRSFQGSIEVGEVVAAFQLIKLDTKYTNVEMNFNPKAKYALDAGAMYTKLSVPTGIPDLAQEEGLSRNERHFVGIFNKESSKTPSRVFMKSFQGHITLN